MNSPTLRIGLTMTVGPVHQSDKVMADIAGINTEDGKVKSEISPNWL
jgi:hypothetical protein